MSYAEIIAAAVGGVATLTGLGALYAVVRSVPPPSPRSAYEAARERAAAARAKRNPL